MKLASAGVMRVAQDPFASIRWYARREPLRVCAALTVGVKATSLEKV
jgi:hypothetical protein